MCCWKELLDLLFLAVLGIVAGVVDGVGGVGVDVGIDVPQNLLIVRVALTWEAKMGDWR